MNGEKRMEIEPIPFCQISKEEGTSKIKFTLPFELVDRDGEYATSICDYVASVKLNKIQVRDYFEKITGLRIKTSEGGKVEILDDTRGFSVITEVEIKLPFVTHQYYFTQISIEYLNRLLDVWRSVTGKYWLKEAISDRDIFMLEWEAVKKDGDGYKGVFYFGLPGRINLPSPVIETEDALPKIIDRLKDEKQVPLYIKFLHNARKHFIERQFDLTIIELNIALEEFVTQFLVTKMMQKKWTEDDIRRILNRCDGLHKIMNRGFKAILNVSLKENKKLWDEFEKMRLLRKNIIHPFIHKASYNDAKETFRIYQNIRSWINEFSD